MAQKGAQPGNNNAGKNKPWRDALHVALARFETDKVKKGTALRKIAEQVVTMAVAGSKEAIQEIGNRLDGKPHQSMDVGHYDATAPEMTDDELASIAARGRNGTAQPETSPQKPSSVH